MPKPAREDRARPVLKFTKSPGFVSTYANNANIAANVWDFRFQFGEVLGKEGDTLQIETRVSVTMSPQHTKAFLNVLAEHVAKYEEEFGPINLPVEPEPTKGKGGAEMSGKKD